MGMTEPIKWDGLLACSAPRLRDGGVGEIASRDEMRALCAYKSDSSGATARCGEHRIDRCGGGRSYSGCSHLAVPSAVESSTGYTTSEMIARTMNAMTSHFAMLIERPAIPRCPKIAAMIASTTNVTARPRIAISHHPRMQPARGGRIARSNGETPGQQRRQHSQILLT
jgi:hypothetical protein